MPPLERLLAVLLEAGLPVQELVALLDAGFHQLVRTGRLRRVVGHSENGGARLRHRSAIVL
jgi:hypothetical protein